MSIIDVSQFQGIPDFRELRREGVVAVYIKATEGVSFVSPTFREQWAKAGEAGLVRGSYHFARQDLHPMRFGEPAVTASQVSSNPELNYGDGYMGCGQELRAWTEIPDATELAQHPALGARDEALHYMRTMAALPGHGGHGWRKGDLRPILDFEVGTKNHRFSPWRDAFFAAMFHSTILYTFPAFNAWKRPPKNSSQLWIADFTEAKRPHVPEGYVGYELWQYTSKGRKRGVRGNVDLSRLGPHTELDNLRCRNTG